MPDQATYMVSVTVNEDRVPDEMEMFSLTLSTADDSVAFDPSSANVIITDTSEQHIVLYIVYVVSMYMYIYMNASCHVHTCTCHVYMYIYIYIIIYMCLMRDWKKERSKQDQTNTQGKATQHTQGSLMYTEQCWACVVHYNIHCN